MDISDNNIQSPGGVSSLGAAVVVFLLALLGTLFGSIIGMAICIPFYSGSVLDLSEAMANPQGNEGMKSILFFSQGFGSAFGMIFIPMAYLKVTQKRGIDVFFQKPIGWLPLVLTAFTVISFMVVNSLFIEWNANFQFPEFMSGFESWARAKEDHLAEITTYLTEFKNVGDFIMAFIVIAIIAPIGEELVFRGFIQTHLHKFSKNIHVAIWVSAILFSAIHMQFFGFIPRLLLGALFGYLYHWSGNLIVPMIAHFVNNGFTLLLVIMAKREAIPYDIENTESLPLSTVLIFAIITAGLLFYFRNHFYRSQVK